MHIALILPSALVQVIVAVPLPMPVTVPSDETVATLLLSLLYVTLLSVAFSGKTVALSLNVSVV